MLRGDFGKSLQYNQPAFPLLMERLPATLQLALLALVLQIGIGVPLGVIAALHRGGWVDNAIRFFGVIGHAIPAFWIGLMLIVLFAVTLRWLPSQGLLTIGKDVWDIGDRIRHIILPAFVLALAGIANYSRYLRTETLDVIAQDYVRTARAKGLGENTVVYVHALRNALIPVVTALGGILAALVSGALIIEQVFTWPGVGQLTYAAVVGRLPLIMAGVMFAARCGDQLSLARHRVRPRRPADQGELMTTIARADLVPAVGAGAPSDQPDSGERVVPPPAYR